MDSTLWGECIRMVLGVLGVSGVCTLWGECIHMVLSVFGVSGVYRALCVYVGFWVKVYIWLMVRGIRWVEYVRCVYIWCLVWK